MKRSILLMALLGVLSIAGVSSSLAQTPKRVAFVESARDRIFVSENGVLDTILAPIPSVQFTASRLAVLASSKDGKFMLIAGKFRYFNPSFQRFDSLQGFFRLSYPLKLSTQDLIQIAGGMSEKLKMLRPVNELVAKVLPMGVIADNDVDWYGVWASSQPGNPAFVMYHGRLDGTGVVDTAYISTAGTDPNRIEKNYHMSNLATSAGGNKVYAVMIDQLTNTSSVEKRWRWIRWEPNAVGTNKFSLANMKANLRIGIQNNDSLMGFALRINPSDNTAEMAFTPTDDNSIQVIKFNADAQSVTVNPANTVRSFDRSIIPSSQTFFTGYTGNAGDVDPQAGQQGNGGDIMYSRDGQSITFITHESDDDPNKRNAQSAVYTFNVNDGSATLVFNDANKMEAQPIFLDDTVVVEPPKPGYVELSATQLNFGTIDTNKTATKTFTISNPSTKAVIVNSISVTGPDASNYVVSGATAPLTLNPSESVEVTVTFSAGPAPAGDKNAMLNVAFADSPDSTRRITLIGKSKIVPGQPNAVKYSRTASFGVDIMPNPVRSNATIAITARTSGLAVMELRDVLGRVVYTFDALRVSTGETREFSVNPQSIGLAEGVYYLTTHLGTESVMQELVVVK